MPVTARLSRTNWQADCTEYFVTSGGGVPYPPHYAIEALGSAKPFISKGLLHDWLLIEFPQVIENITRVEVVKRPSYYSRFKVRLSLTVYSRNGFLSSSKTISWLFLLHELRFISCSKHITFLIEYHRYHYAINTWGSRLKWTFRCRTLNKMGLVLK